MLTATLERAIELSVNSPVTLWNRDSVAVSAAL